MSDAAWYGICKCFCRGGLLYLKSMLSEGCLHRTAPTGAHKMCQISCSTVMQSPEAQATPHPRGRNGILKAVVSKRYFTFELSKRSQPSAEDRLLCRRVQLFAYYSINPRHARPSGKAHDRFGHCPGSLDLVPSKDCVCTNAKTVSIWKPSASYYHLCPIIATPKLLSCRTCLLSSAQSALFDLILLLSLQL